MGNSKTLPWIQIVCRGGPYDGLYKVVSRESVGIGESDSEIIEIHIETEAKRLARYVSDVPFSEPGFAPMTWTGVDFWGWVET